MEENNQYNWNDLFTAAGYLPQQLGADLFDLDGEAPANLADLMQVLLDHQVYFRLQANGLLMEDPAPTLAQWMGWLGEYRVENDEGTSAMEGIHLRKLDVYMRALCRQLHRLGFATLHSCQGHIYPARRGSSPAWISFRSPRQAARAVALLAAHGLADARLTHGTAFELPNPNHADLALAGLALGRLPAVNNFENEERKMDENLLEMFLNLRGGSYNEQAVRNFARRELGRLADDVEVDGAGNLLASLRLGAGPLVLLSAHMDTVDETNMAGEITKEGENWRRTKGILGADDRAGMAAVLLVLRALPASRFAGTVKVAFTVEEESGQSGAERIGRAFFHGVAGAISLDRRGGGDIVTHSRVMRYASPQYGALFECAARDLWPAQHPYACVQGGISDLRVWAGYGIESVNLSVGFMGEHHPGESLHLPAWRRAQSLTIKAMERMSIAAENARRQTRRPA